MKDQDQFAKRVADQLEDDVSPEIQERLRAARMNAVAAVDESRISFARKTWRPLAGAVAAGVLVAALLQQRGIAPMPDLDEQELEAALEMELLDDLLMLAWLDEQSLDAS